MPRGEGGWIRRSDGDNRNPPGSLWRAMVDDLVQDLRFGVRGLTRNPGFTIASVVTLTIGIGATTSIVSIGNAVLLRSLPVAEPDRLAALWESRTGAVIGSWERSMVPYERYEAYQEATSDVFTSLGAYREAGFSLRAGDSGRAFTAEDRAVGPPVVVVNETLARRLWPGENAVGKRLREGRNIFEVIGIARNGKYASVTEQPRAFVFMPFAQAYRSSMTLHVRTQSGATSILELIEREVRALDPNVAIARARVLARVVEASLFDQRFAAGLTGLFGLIGLVLAAIGVYGVLAMHVAQRSREFGIDPHGAGRP